MWSGEIFLKKILSDPGDPQKKTFHSQRHARDCDIDAVPQQSCQRSKGKVLLSYKSVKLQHLLIIACAILSLRKQEVC